MNNILKNIYNFSLETIMEDRFSKYAKEIIQDRALPDVRDGLKPVQRRILYGMYKEKHTFEKPYVKAARCVGDIMGKYHPHGDSSIYDAMVRMSQWWKQNTCLIDMQGNNGSMDGDGAAAMRYTEVRLAKITKELINKDIEKGAVLMSPNFDDTLLEPTILPAKFPNLLVNGASGISAGYATNIPPHNLGEVIDATIKRIDSPNARLETIMDIVKGPDFPTGGIVFGKKGIEDAFQKGRGKIIIRSKYAFEKKKGKEQMVIEEIPFDVNKQALVAKINEIRMDKKVEGIAEVRDESDREASVRIVIELKKDAPKELIVNYLLKNTDLQISYNYNMVAIVNKRPMTLGILPILDAYIAHQKEVTTKRTEFDLAHAKEERHIVEGLMKALSILDEVIQVIRASKNKSHAKENLIQTFQFTEKQAEAIVILQLYRLTNTDVTELIERKKNLDIIIEGLEKILNDEEKLKSLLKEELRNIKKNYGEERKTAIEEEIEEIKLDRKELIPKEDVIVVVTKDGYIKRVSKRSYQKEENTALKEGDYIIGLYEATTLETILLFTNKGNYLYVPIYEIPDLKWKELGKHISNVITLSPGENIIASVYVSNFDQKKMITIFTKNGMVKRSELSLFKAVRYTKPMVCMKVKGNDTVIAVTEEEKEEIVVVTKRGYALRYDTSEVASTGLKTSGVKAISLKEDEVVSAHLVNEEEEYIAVFTNKNTAKRVKLSALEKGTRARRGLLLVRDVKTNPYHILKTYIVSAKTVLGIKRKDDIKFTKSSEIPILDRYALGSSIEKQKVLDVFPVVDLTKEEETKKEAGKETDAEKLEKVDEKIYTIADFLEDFKIE